MATTIKNRRDTAANWTSVNPVLNSGEIGLETDTRYFKIGDGVTAWTSLAYSGRMDGSGDLDMGNNSINNLLSASLSSGGTFADMENASRTIYVDADNGSDTAGDGSIGTPYQTYSKALSTVKNVIADGVTITIHLNSATATYTGVETGRVCIGTGSLVAEGEMATITSGSVSAFTAGASDPVYGASVPVDAVTCGTPGWTTNAYQNYLVRFTKSGEGDKYAVIFNNSTDTLYVWNGIGIDNTWGFEILDWGTKVDGLLLGQGTITAQFLWAGSTGMESYLSGWGNITIQFCKVYNNTASQAWYGISVGATQHIIIDTSVFSGNSSSRRAIHGTALCGFFDLRKSVVSGWDKGIWWEALGQTVGRIMGTRFLNDSTGLSVSNFVVSVYSPFGKSVIAACSTGVYSGPYGFLTATSALYIHTDVTTPWNETNYSGHS